jgi:hypothetical protein
VIDPFHIERAMDRSRNLFSIHHAKLAMAVNWGLAALVYLIVGHLLAGLLVRMAPRRRPVAI